jgi:hypothetical protein
MKRGYKDIEHEKYSAPTKARRKVDGMWTYERLAGGVRKFVQRVRIRVAAISTAKRYAPYSLGIVASYRDIDAYVKELLVGGIRNASNMAKKKFYAHRPKPADNRIKNSLRRAAKRVWQIANEPPMKFKGAATIPLMNAGQLRIVAAQTGVKWYRRICNDRESGRRNSAWYSQSGNGVRECARRLRQMERNGLIRSEAELGKAA